MCAARLEIGNLGVERRGGAAPPFICQIIIAELVTLPAQAQFSSGSQNSSAFQSKHENLSSRSYYCPACKQRPLRENV